ncbi:MAG: TolB-like protein [Ilumatobacteraceae bacterium]|nr:TolB-like protein [Ilumatobacteraceae bacterium]
MPSPKKVLFGALAASSLAVALPASPAHAIVKPTFQITSRVSVLPNGAQASKGAGLAVTPDGRYTVFAMVAPSITGAGSTAQIVRRDEWSGAEVLVSPAYTPGTVPNAYSDDPAISDDGKWIAFASGATNLVKTDTNGHRDVFLRNMDASSTQLISVSSAEVQGNADSQDPSMSGLGDKVAFDSAATNLVSGDTNAKQDVFVRSWFGGTTARVSVSSASVQGNGITSLPSLSGDGNNVAFVSGATNLVAGDTNAHYDVFLRSLASNTTTRVSVAGATQGNADSGVPAISNNGSVVAFQSNASNLVSGDTNGHGDVFAWTRSNGAIERVSLNAFGGQISVGTFIGTAISRDGNVVVWTSKGDDVTLPAGDGTSPNVYSRNIATDFTKLINTRPDGKPSTANFTTEVVTDQTGRRVGYTSDSDDLVREDSNKTYDAFLTDTSVDIGPFSSMANFVSQQYQDFDGRTPTAGELSGGIGEITNGELSPERFIIQRATRAPFATERAPVMRLYWAFFLRAPDKSGFAYWLNKKHNGATLNAIAQLFAKSSEFQNTYGSLSNTDFVKLVYQNVLGRSADAAGLSHWVAKLDTKALTRGAVMVQFSESSEGIRVMAPQTDTVLLFVGMYRALPTPASFDYWRAQVGHPAVPFPLAAALLDSGTYANRFP